MVVVEELDDYSEEFKEFNVRRRFVRRVFSILAVQQIFTLFILAAFMFIEEVAQFALTYIGVFIAASIMFIYALLAITCSDCARRESPSNVIHLIILTVSLAYTTGVLVLFYPNDIVLLALGGTCIITFIVWSLAACTKFDLTRHTGLVVIASLTFLIFLIVSSLLAILLEMSAMRVAYGAVGAVAFSMYLFYDLQTIMGGRSIEISPDEVVYAAARIYVDIVMIFRYLLEILYFRQN